MDDPVQLTYGLELECIIRYKLVEHKAILTRRLVNSSKTGIRNVLPDAKGDQTAKFLARFISWPFLKRLLQYKPRVNRAAREYSVKWTYENVNRSQKIRKGGAD